MHYRKKHPTGKPTLHKGLGTWSYPQVEKGSYKQSRASVKREANKFLYRLKEYYGPIVHR